MGSLPASPARQIRTTVKGAGQGWGWVGLGGTRANRGSVLEISTCFGVRRELPLEVLPLQDVDKEHAGRWVHVAVGV